MPLENLGLGSTLTFDSAQALTGMRRAAGAVAQLESSMLNFKGRVGQLGAELGRFNLLAAGLGSLGIAGMGGFAHMAISAQSEIEDMQIILATTLMNTNKNIKQMGDFSNRAGTAMGIAADQMAMIEVNAAAAPGESRDLLNIYKMILGPMTAAGQTLTQIQDTTQGAAIAAQNLGIPFQDMAFGMAKLVSGNIQNDDTLYRMLKSQSLITESATEWRDLTAKVRLEKIGVIMEKFRKNSDLIGSTWSALTGTIQSIVKMLGAAFIKPLFESVKALLNPITELFLGASSLGSEARLHLVEYWKRVAATAGQVLIPVFRFAVDVLKEVWTNAKTTFQTMKAIGGIVSTAVGPRFREFAVHAAAIGVAFAGMLPVIIGAMFALRPIVSLIQTIGSAFSVVSNIIGGVGTVFGGLGTAIAGLTAGPVIALLGGLALLVGAFVSFRGENESFSDTMIRLWNNVLLPGWQSFRQIVGDVWHGYIEPFLSSMRQGFGVFMPGVLQNLSEAWTTIREAVVLLFDTISTAFRGWFGMMDVGKKDMLSWGAIVGNVLGGIVDWFSTMVLWASRAIGTVVFAITNMEYAFRVAGNAIGMVFDNMEINITNAIRGVYNAIVPVINSIISFLGSIMTKLSQTAIGKKAAQLAGVDIGKMGADLQGMANIGTVDYLQTHKFSDILNQESPGEARIRRQSEETSSAAKKMTDKTAEPMQVVVKDDRKDCIKSEVKVHVDNSAIAAAQARHQIDLNERGGAQDTPYQRRAVMMRSDLGAARR